MPTSRPLASDNVSRSVPPEGDARRAMTKPVAYVFAALLVVAVVVRQFLHYGFLRYYADDAYIFMRYANNFADGQGLTYNAHQPVLGFTSTTFVLVLSLLAFLRSVIALEDGVNVVNTVFFICLSIAIASLSLREQKLRLLMPLAWLFYVPWVDGSLNGMETLLFMLLQYAAIWAFAGARFNLGVALLFVGALTRPEGALFLVAAGATLLRSPPPRFPVKGTVAGVALAAAWAVIATLYYGSPVPQSMVAKSALLTTAQEWDGSTALDKAVLLAIGLSSGQFMALSVKVAAALKVAFAAALLPFVFGAAHMAKRRAYTLAIPGFYVLTWLFYVLGKPVGIWAWYTVPTSFAFMWTCAYGCGQWIESKQLARRLEVPSTIAVTIALLFALPYGMRAKKRSLSGMTSDLIQVADYIQSNCSNAASVMLGDIGQVGYRLPRVRIVDLNALVTPLGTFHDARGQRLPISTVIANEKPDVICAPAQTDMVQMIDGDPASRAGYRRMPPITPRYLLYLSNSCQRAAAPPPLP